MAEFCVDCWNKIMDTSDPKKKFILSRELDLCEECGNYRQVIVAIKKDICWQNGSTKLPTEKEAPNNNRPCTKLCRGGVL